MNDKRIIRGLALAGAVSLSLTMAACSSDDADDATGTADGASPTAASETSVEPGTSAESSQPETEMPAVDEAGPHNDADVEFNHMMMAHHQQAMTMAGLIEGRTDNPDIVDLGARIAETQGREIEEMSSRLSAWGEDPTAPSAHGAHGGGQGDGSAHMDGMLTDEQMRALAEAEGPEFDRLFLEGMIEHHEGAVDMAESIIRDGENEATRELAEGMVDSQQKEIEEMRALLDA
ncbi:DUF305 domain-containing protein [uncultured Corynebacterium sp.]|uniref:DUF305 domain-containing protein n=1 Tax=uncultured Corynebacterium sp. TaxID=159447 RepID=UPI0025FB2C4B|nr:DUF305 domain-containing protein [uncultured Corynebacterium sp.]